MIKLLKKTTIIIFLGLLSYSFWIHIQKFRIDNLKLKRTKEYELVAKKKKNNYLLRKRKTQKENLRIKKKNLVVKDFKKASAPKSTKKKFYKPLFNETTVDKRFSGWGIFNQGSMGGINLLPAWKKFKKNKEVVVAVIDTGVDPYHSFLKNNHYLPFKKTNMQNYGVDFSKGHKFKNRPYDSHGHGTHVAGIIKSIHPGVKILFLKYYNPKASGQENLKSTIEALKYAVRMGVDIINYSGGGPQPAIEELRILKVAEKKGIFISVASGNEESNIDIEENTYYPASYGLNNIMTVTAHDHNVRPLVSSNYGIRSVDISAPGYRIKSSLPNDRGGYHSGTSQATAFVSGVAALIKSQYPDFTGKDIKKIISQSARPFSLMDKRCSSGGILDAASALKFAAQKHKLLAKAETYRSGSNKNRPLKRKLSHDKRIPNASKIVHGKTIYRFLP